MADTGFEKGGGADVSLSQIKKERVTLPAPPLLRLTYRGPKIWTCVDKVFMYAYKQKLSGIGECE